MKTVAYLRVSKETQDVRNQKLAILEFAHREKIQVDNFMELTVSSRKSTKERKLDGAQDIQTKVMITLFGLFAELERELISMRTREAIVIARAAGKKLGRPQGVLGKSKLESRKEERKHLLTLGVPKTYIAKITGVDRATLRTSSSPEG